MICELFVFAIVGIAYVIMFYARKKRILEGLDRYEDYEKGIN
jgi:hypothetical protein